VKADCGSGYPNERGVIEAPLRLALGSSGYGKISLCMLESSRTRRLPENGCGLADVPTPWLDVRIKHERHEKQRLHERWRVRPFAVTGTVR